MSLISIILQINVIKLLYVQNIRRASRKKVKLLRSVSEKIKLKTKVANDTKSEPSLYTIVLPLLTLR